MDKKPPRIKLIDLRTERKERHSFKPPSVRVDPLPPFAIPEFLEFVRQYERYVDHQIGAFLQMTTYASNQYADTELTYWKCVKKSLKHLAWMGSRKLVK